MANTAIIETPITDDPYSEFKGICETCGKFIHWAEVCLMGEFGLLMYHIDCDKAYLSF